MKKRSQPAEPAEEARQAQPGPASKRRRAVTGVTSASPKSGEGSLTRRHSGAAAAAAAAAAGRAESDDDDSGSGGGTEEDEGELGQQREGAGEAPEKMGNASGEDGNMGRKRRFHGLVSVKNSKQRPFRVKVYSIGGRVIEDLGQHRTAEAAARVHDQAAIAVYGRKAVARILNFPASDYAGQQQLFGPDLAARLEYLRALGRHDPGKRPKGGRRPMEGERLARARARMINAQAAFDAKLAPKRALDALAATVEQERRADPLWCPPKEPCGVCPACRQPWRIDLGGCLRLAAVKSEGHSEVGLVQLMVTQPAMFRSVYGKPQKRRQQQQQEEVGDEEGGGAGRAFAGTQREPSPPASQQHAQQEGRQAGEGGTSGQLPMPGSPHIPPHELEWVQQPVKLSHPAALAVQHAGMAPLRQQLAAHEAAFTAALEREQQPGLPVPAVLRAGAARGSSGGGAGTGAGTGAGVAPTSPAAAAAAGGGQRGKAGELDSSALAWVAPGSWLARGSAPRDTLPQADLAGMAQLAALCGEGGVEAPLVPELASEALEAAEAQQERQARLVRRRLGRGHGGGGSSIAGAGSGGEDEEPGTAGESEQQEEDGGSGGRGGETAGGGQQMYTCQLCGRRSHGSGMLQCPVLQLALAVVKPPEDCPGCAHLEKPGCARCLGARGGNFQASLARSQPWTRRVPWLHKVPPATQELMLAAQVAASAAVTDLDRPAAAWRLTPRALLAVGLLAEQAALQELAVRQPAV